MMHGIAGCIMAVLVPRSLHVLPVGCVLMRPNSWLQIKEPEFKFLSDAIVSTQISLSETESESSHGLSLESVSEQTLYYDVRRFFRVPSSS